jgi:DNA-directed RNA polymerase subunit alpha
MIPIYKRRNNGIWAWKVDSIYETENYDSKTLVVEISCPSGFGHSIGNALRRYLLSQVRGCGIVAVKIENCDSPFSPIPGADRLSNFIYDKLPKIRCYITDNSEYIVSTINKETIDNIAIKAEMFETTNLKIGNGDELLCNVYNTNFSMSILVGRGYNYITEKENKNYFASNFLSTHGWFPTSSIFSHITSCRYDVVSTPKMDTIKLEIDGPKDVDLQAVFDEATIDLSIVFGGFESDQQQINDENTKIYDDSFLDVNLDSISNLTIRVGNALSIVGIKTLRSLLCIPPSQLARYSGIGSKSIEDIGCFLTEHLGDISHLEKMQTLRGPEICRNARLYCEAYQNASLSKKKDKKKNESDIDTDVDNESESGDE